MSKHRRSKEPRTICVGDVHGCYDELESLLAKCDVTPSDHVISLGDIVDRGPKTRECVDYFMRRDLPEARSSILGNHEERLLKYHDRWLKIGSPSNPEIIDRNLKFAADYHRTSFMALEPKHFDWFRTLPKFMRLPYKAPDGNDVTLVHAGCVPEVPLEEQSDMLLMHTSNIKLPSVGMELDGLKQGYWTGNEPSKWTSKAPADWPFWASFYDGSNGHVIFGHSGFDAVAKFPHATGIDTGAVFGRNLTALVLPDWKFVSVPARKVYKASARVRLYEVYPGISVYS